MKTRAASPVGEGNHHSLFGVEFSQEKKNNIALCSYLVGAGDHFISTIQSHNGSMLLGLGGGGVGGDGHWQGEVLWTSQNPGRVCQLLIGD